MTADKESRLQFGGKSTHVRDTVSLRPLYPFRLVGSMGMMGGSMGMIKGLWVKSRGLYVCAPFFYTQFS